MPLVYLSGEEIRKGDRVLYHGEDGVVEFIAQREDPETAWYAQNLGGGCMILAEGFGSVFVSEPDDNLELVGRSSA